MAHLSHLARHITNGCSVVQCLDVVLRQTSVVAEHGHSDAGPVVDHFCGRDKDVGCRSERQGSRKVITVRMVQGANGRDVNLREMGSVRRRMLPLVHGQQHT